MDESFSLLILFISKLGHDLIFFIIILHKHMH